MHGRTVAPALVVLLLGVLPLASRAQSTSAQEHGDYPAVHQMLRLFELREPDAAVELGAQLVRAHPDAPAVHALYTIAYSRYGGAVEAVALGERNVARWPEDAWTQAALAVVLPKPSRLQEAFAAAVRARQLAPDDPDIATQLAPIYWAAGRQRELIAIVDTFIVNGRATADLRIRRANHMNYLANQAQPRDTALYRQGFEELAAIQADWPTSPLGFTQEGILLLNERRVDEAIPFFRRAVALAPNSSNIRVSYWRALAGRVDLEPDEKAQRITADLEAFLKLRQYSPDATFAAAQFLSGTLKDEERALALGDRLVGEHPTSWQAARVEHDRTWILYDSIKALNGADSVAAVGRYRSALQAVMQRPGVNGTVGANARRDLLWSLVDDPTSDGEEIWAQHEALEAVAAPNQFAFLRYLVLPITLAERGVRIAEAEALARRGLDVGEDVLEQRRETLTVARYAEDLDWIRVDAYSTIGWIHFHAGDLAGARRELERAHETANNSPEVVFRLGRVAEAAGETEEAERWYALGGSLEKSRFNSTENHDALTRLYAARHGSLDGFEAYVASVDERESVRRREKIESDRIADPAPLPAFQLAWLDGEGRFDSRSFEGKIAVINFWGV